MKKINFTNLINYLYPEGIKCVICNEELPITNEYSMCDKCFSKLPYNNNKTCLLCGEPLYTMANYCLHCKNYGREFSQCVSNFIYAPPISTLIQKFKYNNCKYLAKPLSYFMFQSLAETNWEIDYVIPIPLHNKKQKQRGYNQSELLSENICNFSHLPLRTDILIRNKLTSTQTNLSRIEREENIQDSFFVTNKKEVYNKNILLVDDVFTTGSTANECAKTLRKNHAKEVYVLTCAHAKTSNAVNNLN